MICSVCQHENDTDASFCEECGSKLQLVCAECGRALKPSAKFCPGCGASIGQTSKAAVPEPRQVADYTPKHLADKILQSRAALEGERKQVTVLFADVKGSMNLAAQVGPEAWHHILDRFFAILGEGIHRYEGTINQYTGDGIMALFGAPIGHEDHAQRACYAALQMRDDLRRLSVELRMEQGIDFTVRIGINSGDVVVGRIGDDLRMDYTAQGHTVGIAQRIEQLAEAGHVYISEHTARLVESYFELTDLGASDLAGVEGPLTVFDLQDATQVRTRLQVSRARGLTQFVGRDDEIHLLETALGRAQSGHGQVVGVVGDPGLGKSRLCYEFVQSCRARGVPVYECHCPPHGKTIPFLPILELFRNYFGVSEHDSPAQARQKIAGTLVLLDSSLQSTLPTLFDFLGIPDPELPAPPTEAEARKRQLFEMLHKITRAQSERGLPSVVLVDDLHWIDGWSDEFVAQMVEAVENSHGLVLVNFRPEYSAPWNAKPYYQQLPLVPLGKDAVRHLVSGLLGDDDSVQALTEKIMTWTAGNPLFAEEVINTLIETKQLEGYRGSYRLTRSVTALEVPATVQAIIAARIDRLQEADKTLLHAAAVIGKDFSRPLLERVVNSTATDFSASIEHLKAGDFLFETALYPTVEYSFKHPLVHEVAYETQLKDKLAERHAAVATAIEDLQSDRIDEFASMLAYHWERAANDQKALQWHERAALVANANDPDAALAHWRKVRDFVDRLQQTPEVLSAGARACGALMAVMWRLGISVEEAKQYFEDGSMFADRAGDLKQKAILTGSYSIARGWPNGFANDYVTYAEKAIALADQTDDPKVQIVMRNFRAWGLLICGRLSEAIVQYDEVAETISNDEGAKNNPAYAEEYVYPNLHWSHIWGRAYAYALQGDLKTYEKERDYVKNFVKEESEALSYREVVESYLSCILGNFATARMAAHRAYAGADTIMTKILATWQIAQNHFYEGDAEQARQLLGETLTLAETKNSCGSWKSGIVGTLMEVELGAGYAERAVELGVEIDAFCDERELYWDLTPWIALSKAYTALGDQCNAEKTLDKAQHLVDKTAAKLYQPLVHECQALFAETFGDRWDKNTELKAAIDSFGALGATAQIERLQSS